MKSLVEEEEEDLHSRATAIDSRPHLQPSVNTLVQIKEKNSSKDEMFGSNRT